MAYVRFKDGPASVVHYNLFDRTRKLVLFCDSGFQCGNPTSLSTNMEHVLRRSVHYLYTNNYHTPKWIGLGTDWEEATTKLKVGFEVYVTARQYDLEGLEDLAKEQILIHSSKLDAFTVLDAVYEVYPSSAAQDTWFPQFMEKVVKTALENPGALVKAEDVSAKTNAETRIPIATTLLRGVLKVYQEMAEAQKTKDAMARLPKIIQPTTNAVAAASSLSSTAAQPKLEKSTSMFSSFKSTLEPTKQSTLTATGSCTSPGLVDLLSSNCHNLDQSSPLNIPTYQAMRQSGPGDTYWPVQTDIPQRTARPLSSRFRRAPVPCVHSGIQGLV